MKKIKLFALAAFAMLSTNVFAQATDGESATRVFAFQHFADGTATIKGFVSGLEDELKAGVVIPETVEHPSQMDGGHKRKYFVKKIAAGAFADEPIQTIAFPAAVPEDDYTGIDEIGAGAFKGTKIQTLDLSNTIITKVDILFGTVIAADAKNDVVNATVKSVTLPATVTQIVAGAFANCTKLATLDMSAATALVEPGDGDLADDKGIGVKAFAGCPIKNLDLSKNTTVTGLVANTLKDGARFKASEVETVTLHKAFETLNGNLAGDTKLTTVSGHIFVKPNKTEETAFTLSASEFEGCTALTTIDTHKIATFSNSCFKGCSALASLDISAATSIGTYAFAGTALTSVTIPVAKLFTTISEGAFFECAALETVTIGVAAADGDGVTKDKTNITNIGTNAFGYTAIKAFTLPAKNTTGFTIAEKAFIGCSSLKEFTYAPEGIVKADAIKINTGAFNRCSGIAFHTSADFATAWRQQYDEASDNYDGPTNTTFDYSVSDGQTKFELTPYKSNPNKYYVKWNGSVGDTPTNIRIKKGDAKVYAAYVDADGSVNLTQYYAEGGYVYILQSDVALIITENAELTYEKMIADKSTSWQTVPNTGDYTVVTGNTKNALKYVTANTTRATLESGVDEGWYIYGWVNKSDACGFQKITSGTTIKEGVLFAWGKPAANGRLTINWYDENGNLEGETTAIDAIVNKAAEAEGESYNLAGQKVNASYKGVVIKNGKKMIQK